MKDRIYEESVIFLLAVQFLTRLPVPRDPGWSEARMEATPRWYPAVGLVVGAISALVFCGSDLVLPQVLAAILATGAGIVATGAFHEDGFADCCDGLGGAVSRERALEIMKDSRLGTYGAVGIGLVLATKVAALATLPADLVPWILIVGHCLSRASSVAVIATGHYVRDHGTGKPVASGTSGLWFAWVMSLLALGCAGFVAPVAAVGAGALGLVVGHLAMRRVFEPRLGGYTGDCLGAVQQISEIGFLLGLLAVIGT